MQRKATSQKRWHLVMTNHSMVRQEPEQMFFGVEWKSQSNEALHWVCRVEHIRCEIYVWDGRVCIGFNTNEDGTFGRYELADNLRTAVARLRTLTLEAIAGLVRVTGYQCKPYQVAR